VPNDEDSDGDVGIIKLQKFEKPVGSAQNIDLAQLYGSPPPARESAKYLTAAAISPTKNKHFQTPRKSSKSMTTTEAFDSP
tara:strand:+ start:552 stop:794 length:243 start_codon:yes stop_codon:yes gene_type:complete